VTAPTGIGQLGGLDESADATSGPTPSAPGPSSGSWLRTWGPWLAMACILAVALLIGTATSSRPPDNAERVYIVARTIKCPQCAGQSVAESDIQISREIRRDIARRIEAGQTDDQIRDYYRETQGADILLTPSSSGLTGLVWILPVVALAGAGLGLGLTFARWRRQPQRTASDDDRALVAAALEGSLAADPAAVDDAGPNAEPEG